MKKIQDINVANRRIILRADFNVSLEEGDVKEKFKIAAVKETLEYLLQKNAKVALTSHLGRPEGKINPEFSLLQIKDDIERILGVKIVFINDCVGEKVKNALDNLKNSEVLLLENVRFHSEEESNDSEFAEKMAENFDIFINDAFSVCHRNQASVTGITKFLPSFGGFRLQKEIENLKKIEENPVCPIVTIIGGAKIETKLPVIKFFENKCGNVLVGGKVANEAIDEKIVFSDHVIFPEDFIDDRLEKPNKKEIKLTSFIFPLSNFSSC